MPAVITRYECPVESCPWNRDDPGPDPGDCQGETLDAAVRAGMLAYALRTEAVVRAHLETHSLLEWVQEVMRLRGERDQALAAQPVC